MKQYIKSLLNSAMLRGVRKGLFEGKALILMLHRIAPIDFNKLPANENMKVDPQFLESFIIDMKNKGYQFISIDELITSLCNHSLKEKSICITIDDGYKDNFEYGFEIFRKYEIPFCVYMCAAFLDKTADMWWFGLEDFLLQNDKINFNGQDMIIDTLEAKNNAFLKLRNELICHINDYSNATEIMDKYKIHYNPKEYHDLALSVDEVRSMMGGGLLTIGHHTYSHPIFNNLTNDQIKQDVFKANEFFKQTFNEIPSHFAYPFGSRVEVSKQHFDLIKELGFKSATTTRFGSIFDAHKSYLHSLPRVFFDDSFKMESVFNFRKQRVVTQ